MILRKRIWLRGWGNFSHYLILCTVSLPRFTNVTQSIRCQSNISEEKSSSCGWVVVSMMVINSEFATVQAKITEMRECRKRVCSKVVQYDVPARHPFILVTNRQTHSHIPPIPTQILETQITSGHSPWIQSFGRHSHLYTWNFKYFTITFTSCGWILPEIFLAWLYTKFPEALGFQQSSTSLTVLSRIC